jgi:hypothetical protein
MARAPAPGSWRSAQLAPALECRGSILKDIKTSGPTAALGRTCITRDPRKPSLACRRAACSSRCPMRLRSPMGEVDNQCGSSFPSMSCRCGARLLSARAGRTRTSSPRPPLPSAEGKRAQSACGAGGLQPQRTKHGTPPPGAHPEDVIATWPLLPQCAHAPFLTRGGPPTQAMSEPLQAVADVLGKKRDQWTQTGTFCLAYLADGTAHAVSVDSAARSSPRVMRRARRGGQARILCASRRAGTLCARKAEERHACMGQQLRGAAPLHGQGLAERTAGRRDVHGVQSDGGGGVQLPRQERGCGR